LAIFLGIAVGRFITYRPAGTDEQSGPRRRTPTAAQTVAALERAVRRTPQDLRGWQSLGAAYVHRAVQTADPGYYTLADKALDRADVLAPDQNQTLIARGALALSRHQFAVALELGSRVHDRDPTQPDALAVIVDAEVELGRYDAAGLHLQELLDRRPGIAAYSRVSYLRELHGDLDGAVVAMRQAEVAGSASPFDVATVTTFLGDLEFNQGRLDEADAAYGRALRLQPDLPLAALGRARVWAAKGDRPRAITALDALTRRVPLPSAVTLLGDLQALEARDADAARSVALVRTIGRLQQSAGQVTDLEMALFEADHSIAPAGAAHAVELARAAYAARPDNIHTADALAWSLYRAGETAAALPYVDQAMRLGSGDALLHYHAAAVLDDAGDPDRARAELGLALSRNPWFSFRHRADAAALATKLGIPLPGTWAGK
jgi:predicted Zn-dependent protease